MMRIFTFALLLVIVACNSGSGPVSPPDPPLNNPGDNWREILNNPNASVAERVSAALAGIEEDVCYQQEGDKSTCDQDIFLVNDIHVESPFLEREAVLVIDELAPAVEMLRYRNRILGFYRMQVDGSISSEIPSWELPKTFGDIVTGFAISPFVPSEDLSAVGSALNDVYSEHVPTVGSHGLGVFNILADLIPNNPIIFLDNNLLPFNQSIPDVFCAVDSADPSDPNLVALLQRAARTAESLSELFVAHNIRYINASWGYTIETIRGPWQRVCGTAVPPEDVLLAILETYRPVFDVLFSTPGVFTAHAGFVSPNNAHYPFDQILPEFPNRLRVGVFQHVAESVPEQGLVDVPAAYAPTPPEDDADVYINTACDYNLGCRAKRSLTLAGLYGMGRIEFPLSQTSFNTPVLLGRFIFERNQPQFRDRSMDDALIQDLSSAITPACGSESARCRYLDPLLHMQLERYLQQN